MEMGDILDKITEIVEAYSSGAWVSTDTLLEMARELSGEHYKLTRFNIEAYNRYNGVLHLHKGSVASGRILADEQVPELRMTRKILESVNHTIWSMRSEISIIKKES